jgi:hypothetical protein
MFAGPFTPQVVRVGNMMIEEQGALASCARKPYRQGEFVTHWVSHYPVRSHSGLAFHFTGG